ncbi:DinB family protein [Alkalihalobacillus sp. LMS6]|uniref:DinB family protein n=1 Tax=Bacillaceae TaxID=186817 RepID=UPI000C077B7A|nr:MULTISPECIES: DinB family protein [Bacillaceae]UTR07116.1 DinB family protein [Alkalihalobacillus sp. LMS6]
MIDYRIRSVENYTDKIGELVSMLEHARQVTLSEISSFDQFELDYLPSHQANSIGSLLFHIASIEFVHQVISFEKRDLTLEEIKKWGMALSLGSKARQEITGHSLNYYLDTLSEVRGETLALLKSKDDTWLFEEHNWDNGVPYNNYYVWFHVMEDEMNHRGQIRALKRQLGYR